MPQRTKTTFSLGPASGGLGRWDAVFAPWTDTSGNRWKVFIEVKSIQGRLAPAALMIEPMDRAIELSHSTLAEIPIRDLLMEVTKRELDAFVAQKDRMASGPHEGRAHTDEELRRLADVYDEARRNQLPVQRTVADAFGISVSTASKRIMAARARGFLDSNHERNNK
jgi:hypothetical protein